MTQSADRVRRFSADLWDMWRRLRDGGFNEAAHLTAAAALAVEDLAPPPADAAGGGQNAEPGC